MKLVAGIDGGQSSTVAAIVDASGVVRGRGTAGPSDHVDEPDDSERAARACMQAVAHALTAAGLPRDTRLEAVTIGLSGYEGQWHGALPSFATANVRYVHDAPIALAGALDERPAGVVVAGTGSAGYADDGAGRTFAVGGYGYLFGDAGSGFAIARDALAAAMEAADTGETTGIELAARAYFDVPDLRALARAVALRRIPRPQLAAFARLVLDAARLGDPEAAAVVEDAASALARLARTLAGRVGASAPLPVAFVGGIAQHPLIVAGVRANLTRAAGVAFVAPEHEPAVGAALLAFDAAGLPRPRIAAS